MDYFIHHNQYAVVTSGQVSTTATVFLHGFTGTAMTWQPVWEAFQDQQSYKIAIDLYGHGQSTAHAPFSMAQQIEDLHELFSRLNLQELVLVGYSMGGRVALAYAATHPSAIKMLMLESASPGLVTNSERLERTERDNQLAKRIEEQGMQAFVDFWEEIPLFATQKALPLPVRQAVRQERLSQTPSKLANSLRFMGTGSQKSYWEQLPTLSMPVRLFVGMEDQKFISINQRMLTALPNASLQLVPATGHAIHVEKPVEFATMIEEYLQC